MHYLVRIGDQKFSVTDIDREQGQARLNGRVVRFDFQHVRGSLYSLIVDGKVFSAHLESDQETIEINQGPNVFRAEVDDERAALLRQLARSESAAAGTVEIKAPMPGLVVRLAVQKGEAVTKGQSLVVIEAMKMENDIRSPASGVVATIHVAERTAVEKNAPLVTLAG